MTRPMLIGSVSSPDLHVATLNLRRILPARSGGADAWAGRAPLLRRLVAAERPALLSVQEALPAQLDVIAEALGSGYKWYGAGRNTDGSGEHCSVFVDTRRVAVDESRQFALSATPDVAGSRSWGALFPRIAVVLRLRDRSTGSRFQLINTHLDPFSAGSRRRSAELLRGAIDASELPTVFTADANSRIGSASYRTLTAGSALVDSWTSAEERLTPEWRTYSNYRPPRLGPRIDWLLVSPRIRVRAAAVNAVRYDGRSPSDHEPVHAVLRVPR